MSAYYNEHDPFAAAWLRELIKENLIAPGDVDERTIEDVRPSDLAGYTQCHFFAGIGVWSHALRTAGWPDDTPVWTGSCPCQSFSQSGKGEGFSDKRHLWPAWFRLLRESRPDVCFGEQVSNQDGLAWFDVVASEMEGVGYTVAALSTTAAGVGAPHIRQRLYFVADAFSGGRGPQRISRGLSGQLPSERTNIALPTAERSPNCDMDNPEQPRLEGHARNGHHRHEPRRERTDEAGSAAPPGSPNFWANAEWIYCKDGKYRPVEPSIFPLANGTPNRVGTLRGAGNALCAPQATAFITAYLDTL